MLATLSADELAIRITEDAYERAVQLSLALGAGLGRPKAPRIADDVRPPREKLLGGLPLAASEYWWVHAE